MGVAMEKGARLRDVAGRAARHAAARRAVSAGASGKRAQTQALLLEAG
ncbi:Transcriptional regulator, partial [human gut metagenome]